MERLQRDYSNKNIPIPTKEEYKIQLISNVESILKRMRCKALQFLGKLESINKETYEFKSQKYPQTIDELLIGFEDDLMSLIKNIEFCNICNTFQAQLASDTKQIKCTNNLIFPTDKTRNLYKVEKENYKKHLRDNITKTYQK